MHMHTARKIARKTSEKPLNLKGEMCFATETSLGGHWQLPLGPERWGARSGLANLPVDVGVHVDPGTFESLIWR
jgi:hypothetical protein